MIMTINTFFTSSREEATGNETLLSKENIIKKLDELQLLLKDYDSEALSKYDEIGKISGFESQQLELARTIETYDFETALKKLDELKFSLSQ